jgi:hypothetical protein
VSVDMSEYSCVSPGTEYFGAGVDALEELSIYLRIGIFQVTSVPVDSAGSGGVAGGVMSVGAFEQFALMERGTGTD